MYREYDCIFKNLSVTTTATSEACVRGAECSRLHPRRTHQELNTDAVPVRGGEAWRAGSHPRAVASPRARPALRKQVDVGTTRQHRKRRVSGITQKCPADEMFSSSNRKHLGMCDSEVRAWAPGRGEGSGLRWLTVYTHVPPRSSLDSQKRNTRPWTLMTQEAGRPLPSGASEAQQTGPAPGGGVETVRPEHDGGPGRRPLQRLLGRTG